MGLPYYGPLRSDIALPFKKGGSGLKGSEIFKPKEDA
jgi:hypothetical protein